jgi:hypothetical protein
MAGSIYAITVRVSGNGFIAAFIAGLTFGNIIQERCKFTFAFTDCHQRLTSEDLIASKIASMGDQAENRSVAAAFSQRTHVTLTEGTLAKVHNSSTNINT